MIKGVTLFVFPHQQSIHSVTAILSRPQYLRYLCELDWIHPEDQGRIFVLSYSLADGKIKIGEIPRRNSGFRDGLFLKSMQLELPDSDHSFPTYYTPDKFYIGKYHLQASNLLIQVIKKFPYR